MYCPSPILCSFLFHFPHPPIKNVSPLCNLFPHYPSNQQVHGPTWLTYLLLKYLSTMSMFPLRCWPCPLEQMLSFDSYQPHEIKIGMEENWEPLWFILIYCFSLPLSFIFSHLVCLLSQSSLPHLWLYFLSLYCPLSCFPASSAIIASISHYLLTLDCFPRYPPSPILLYLACNQNNMLEVLSQ